MNALSESLPPQTRSQVNQPARPPVSSAPPPGPAAGRILIVSGNADPQAARALSLAGHEVYECHDLRGLCFALKHQKPDVVFVEQSAIGPLDQTLRVIRGRHQSVPVLLLTGDRNLGLNPIRFGYYAVMPHPLDPEQLMVVTAHALAHHRMSLRIAELEVEASGHGFYGIVGRSAYARRLFHKLQSAAASDVHILLTGEPGTGKALTARAIHDRSARARGPFIALNGAKLSETAFSAEALMSATLGSTELRRNGALDDADRGTLYIAHIDKLNPRLQDQLLAALKNGSQSDFRLIASSEESLDQVVARGQFRNDLYAHIVQHPVQLMPLRSRPMDIEPTSRLMLEEISNELGRGRLSLAPRTLTVLERYSFPQNMTELRRILTAAVKLSASDIIEVDALPGELRHEPVPSVNSGAHSLPPDSKQQRHALLFELLAKAPMKMRDVERCAIEAALRRTEDNVTQAMRELGIGRTTLYRKLKKYGRR